MACWPRQAANHRFEAKYKTLNNNFQHSRLHLAWRLLCICSCHGRAGCHQERMWFWTRRLFRLQHQRLRRQLGQDVGDPLQALLYAVDLVLAFPRPLCQSTQPVGDRTCFARYLFTYYSGEMRTLCEWARDLFCSFRSHGIFC